MSAPRSSMLSGGCAALIWSAARRCARGIQHHGGTTGEKPARRRFGHERADAGVAAQAASSRATRGLACASERRARCDRHLHRHDRRCPARARLEPDGERGIEGAGRRACVAGSRGIADRGIADRGVADRGIADSGVADSGIASTVVVGRSGGACAAVVQRDAGPAGGAGGPDPGCAAPVSRVVGRASGRALSRSGDAGHRGRPVGTAAAHRVRRPAGRSGGRPPLAGPRRTAGDRRRRPVLDPRRRGDRPRARAALGIDDACAVEPARQAPATRNSSAAIRQRAHAR